MGVRREGLEQWGILCPPCGMGSVSPPGVKEQRLVSWAQGQLLGSIVCSGHPLGQQRRQERLVWGAAKEQGLLSRYSIQR